MFTIKTHLVKNRMYQNGLDAATLATRAEVGKDFVQNIIEGRNVRVMDFAPLVRLGNVLKTSPFELIQNNWLM